MRKFKFLLLLALLASWIAYSQAMLKGLEGEIQEEEEEEESEELVASMTPRAHCKTTGITAHHILTTF